MDVGAGSGFMKQPLAFSLQPTPDTRSGEASKATAPQEILEQAEIVLVCMCMQACDDS